MVVPNGQESQQTCRKAAMHSQKRTEHAMPVLYDATGPYSLIPSREQNGCALLPFWWQVCKQLASLGTKERSTLPCPADQRDGLWSQSQTSFLLDWIERMSKS